METTFRTIRDLRATYRNDFKEFTSCAHKYLGKTEPFLRWKIENLDEYDLCLALYHLSEELDWYEEDYDCRPKKPIEYTMMKREFYKRTGLRWDEVAREVYEDCFYDSSSGYDDDYIGPYASINMFTIREIAAQSHGDWD